MIMYWTERFDSHLFPAEILKYAQINGQIIHGNTAHPYETNVKLISSKISFLLLGFKGQENMINTPPPPLLSAEW